MGQSAQESIPMRKFDGDPTTQRLYGRMWKQLIRDTLIVAKSHHVLRTFAVITKDSETERVFGFMVDVHEPLDQRARNKGYLELLNVDSIVEFSKVGQLELNVDGI